MDKRASVEAKPKHDNACSAPLEPLASRLTVASYGGGTNSTAMLIECANRGEPVDLILFADTGAERPYTYGYIESFSDWLEKNGLPRVEIVRSPNETLEQSCLKLGVLPSLAYGFKSCSQRFKGQPQNVYLNNWDRANAEWAGGRKVVKLIGYDADEPQRAKNHDDEKYTVRYPLLEWDMGRDECVETIEAAGLCQPGKSSCFFCPSMRATEIRQLQANYPDLSKRALALESNARKSHVAGLGRRFAWRDLLAQAEMFGDEYSHTPELACGCYDG